MFKHEKQLFHPVAVERPNPQYAALLQEQLGGGNGELKAEDTIYNLLTDVERMKHLLKELTWERRNCSEPTEETKEN